MIKVSKITKEFGTFTALNNLSSTIPSGCVYGMVGSNGAGKSTFLRLLAGIYRPDIGTILFDGEPVYENEEVKNKIAFVPDDLFFLPQSNLQRMSSLYINNYPNFSETRFNELTERFGLDKKANIGTFSKGMKRQAAIILALSTMPSYLFLDETYDGLDPVMRNFVKKIIYSDVEERGITAIITSHSLRELEDTCDQLALLHKGGIIFESDIQNIKTSLFKVQVAFDYNYDKKSFPEIQMLDFIKRGSVANIIVRGDRDFVTDYFNARHPLLCEILPLTLEEVFVYEMEALGYSFKDVLM